MRYIKGFYNSPDIRKTEVIAMDKEHIKQLFYTQIRALTMKTCDTFDYQFSDRWAGGE